jgi:taurine dioxygenase
MDLQFKPYHHLLGVEVTAPARFDVAWTDATREQLRSALDEHGLVVFPPGFIRSEEFPALAEVFGTISTTSTYRSPLQRERPTVATLDSRQDGGLRNHIWHIDTTFDADPPFITALHGHEIPEAGGDTVFSNAVLAYERLPRGLAQYLETLTATNSGDTTGFFSPDRYPDPEVRRQIRDSYPPVEVPVIRTHPRTGKKQIFVTEAYTLRINGVEPSVSRHLLALLFDAVNSVEVQVRFRWRQGATLFWDNRVVQHRVVRDYGNRRRVLHRLAVRPFEQGQPAARAVPAFHDSLPAQAAA